MPEQRNRTATLGQPDSHVPDRNTTLLYVGVTYYEFGDVQKALDCYGGALVLWDTSLEKTWP